MELTTPTDTPITRADVALSLEPLLNPFTILVDTAETLPYRFQNIDSHADWKRRVAVVTPGINYIRECLGRHPKSLGDYSLSGAVGRCHVERKSMDDAHGTILGFTDGRRARFKQELANLSNIECAIVIVECSWNTFLEQAPEWERGKKTAACNREQLGQSVIAFRQDYQVDWQFCDSRDSAELFTFRFLERFFRKHKKELAK